MTSLELLIGLELLMRFYVSGNNCYATFQSDTSEISVVMSPDNTASSLITFTNENGSSSVEATYGVLTEVNAYDVENDINIMVAAVTGITAARCAPYAR